MKSLAIFSSIALLAAPSFCAGQTSAEISRIEKRLEKIEAMLQKLTERTPLASPAFGLETRAFVLPESLKKRELLSARLQADTPPTDRDADGLTDAEEQQLGTDPQNRDTDGDALLDGWEVHGVNGINLHAMGASPLHKDIFVEMDFMSRQSASNGLGPNANVIEGIKAAFRNAPVSNPDNVKGINIHLEPGNEVPYDADLSPLIPEFAAIKAANFDAKRAPVFHYMIWANGYNGGSSSGYSMNIPHSDFIVTLGRWNGNAGGTDLQKIGTFIHELGHNLGLKHGGSEHVNYKPNHLSVMNYNFQTAGILRHGSRLFSYQPFPLPALRERTLRERDGLGRSGMLQGYHTIFKDGLGTRQELPCHDAIDWNGNASADADPQSVDLNGDTLQGELLSTPDEWAQLIYNGGAIGSQDTLEGALEDARDRFEIMPFEELTEETERLLRQQGARPGADRPAPRPGPNQPELDEATDRQIQRSLRRQ